MSALGTVFSVIPAMLYLLIAAAGIVVVVRSRSAEPWARLALLGLGLLAAGEICGFILTGAVLGGASVPISAVYNVISLLGMLAHFVGFGLLVASALSGRAALSGLGRSTPEGVAPPPR